MTGGAEEGGLVGPGEAVRRGGGQGLREEVAAEALRRLRGADLLPREDFPQAVPRPEPPPGVRGRRHRGRGAEFRRRPQDAPDQVGGRGRPGAIVNGHQFRQFRRLRQLRRVPFGALRRGVGAERPESEPHRLLAGGAAGAEAEAVGGEGEEGRHPLPPGREARRRQRHRDPLDPGRPQQPLDGERQQRSTAERQELLRKAAGGTRPAPRRRRETGAGAGGHHDRVGAGFGGARRHRQDLQKEAASAPSSRVTGRISMPFGRSARRSFPGFSSARRKPRR